MRAPSDHSPHRAGTSPASVCTGQPRDALGEDAFIAAVANDVRLIVRHPSEAITFTCPTEGGGKGETRSDGEVEVGNEADGEAQAGEASHPMRGGVSAAEAAMYEARTGEDESYNILHLLDGDRVRCPGKMCNAALRRVSLYGHVQSTSVHAGGKKPLPAGALEEIKRLFTATAKRNSMIKNSRASVSGAPVDGAVRSDQKSIAGGRLAHALNRVETGADSALLTVFPAGQVQCPVCLAVLKARELAAHVDSSGGKHRGFGLSAKMRAQIDHLADDDNDIEAFAPAATLDASNVDALPTRLGHLRLTYLDKERMVCPFESCGVSLNICNFYQHATKSKKFHPPGSILPRHLEAIRQLSRITNRNSYRKRHALGRISSRPSFARDTDVSGIDGGRAASRVGLPPRSKGPLHLIPLADVPVHPKLVIDRNHVHCPACPARVLVRNLIRHLEDSPRCKNHVLAEKQLHNGLSLYTGILVLRTAYQRDYITRRDVAVAKEKAEGNVNAYVTAYRLAHACFPPAPSKKRSASRPSLQDSVDLPEAKRPRALPPADRQASSLQSIASPVASIRAPTPVAGLQPVAHNTASDVATRKLATFPPSLQLDLKSVVEPSMSGCIACPVPECGKMVPLAQLRAHTFGTDCQPLDSLSAECKLGVDLLILRRAP